MQTSQLKTAEIYSFTTEATWIRCESGLLWVSHDGEDIVLERGDKCFVSGTDRTVLEALQDSRFSTFKEPSTQTAARRFEQVAAAH
ncbi:MAG: DUF2917 domain-containing protein [Deefgea sp.]